MRSSEKFIFQPACHSTAKMDEPIFINLGEFEWDHIKHFLKNLVRFFLPLNKKKQGKKLCFFFHTTAILFFNGFSKKKTIEPPKLF